MTLIRMSELWVERHRPRTVEDIRGQASVVKRLASYAKIADFPHLLFAGPPGTGKTTAAMALTRDVFGPDFRNNLLDFNEAKRLVLFFLSSEVLKDTAPIFLSLSSQ